MTAWQEEPSYEGNPSPNALDDELKSNAFVVTCWDMKLLHSENRSVRPSNAKTFLPCASGYRKINKNSFSTAFEIANDEDWGRTTEQNRLGGGANVLENVGHGPGRGGKCVPSTARFPIDWVGEVFALGGMAVMVPPAMVRPSQAVPGPVAVYAALVRHTE